MIAQTEKKDNVATKTEKIIIQVAALTSSEKVTELRARLTKAGITSYVVKVKMASGEERTRVRVGPLSSQAEYDKMCPRLAKLNLPCTIVSR